MKKILLLNLCGCFISSIAFAAPAAKPMAICITKAGVIQAKTKCAKTDKALNTASLQALSIKGDTGPQGPVGAQGAQGSQGVQGVAGLLNTDTCTNELKVGASCSEGSACTTTLVCGGGTGSSSANDLMIDWAFTSDSFAAYVAQTTFQVPSGKKYPTGIEITTTSEEGFGAHTPSLAIICCRP